VDTARQFLAVAFVLALLAAARWSLRRGAGPLRALRSGRQQGKTLEVLDRITLTPQHSLHVVRNGSEQWILATHPQGCSVVQKNRPPGDAI
jgi:flagellar biogenesis protein FliO